MNNIRPCSDALALASPSGKMSKRARVAAQARIANDLFPAGYWTRPAGAPTDEHARTRARAAELLALADRGMSPRKHRKEAARLLATLE